MPKIDLTDIASLTNEQSAIASINTNYATIETESDSFLSRDGTSPNQMEADLDMNSNRILNLPVPASATEPARKAEVDAVTSDGIGVTTVGFLTNTVDTTPSWVTRTLTAGTGISISNNDGVAGNPVLSIDADLAAIGAVATNGILTRTADDTWTTRTITGPAAGVSVSNGDGVSGNPTIALANDLAGVEGLGTNGLAVRTGTDTWTTRTLTAPAAGITVTFGDGISGNPTLGLANDLSGVEALSTNGIAVRQTTDTWLTRSVAAGTGITVSNGDAVNGDPTVALDSVANGTVLGNVSGSAGAPTATTVSTLLDGTIGSAIGGIAYRGPGGWTGLAAGTNGTYLETNGAGVAPTWTSPISVGNTITRNPYATTATTTGAHGLSAAPTFCKILLTCLTGEHGYTAGQVLDLSSTNFISQGGATGMTLAISSTTVSLVHGTGAPTIINASTGAAGVITPANWRLDIVPYLVNA